MSERKSRDSEEGHDCLGILLAIASGIIGAIWRKPFLTGLWWPAPNAVAGTPLLFDVGVFLVVLGAILAVLLAMEEN